MSSPPRAPARPPRQGTADLPEENVWLGLVVGGLMMLWLRHVISRHPLLPVVAVIFATAAIWIGARLYAHTRDWQAAQNDPKGPGLTFATVQGDWPGAARRPFILPWRCFSRHVLVLGPTGSGKSYSAIDPILRAHVRRRHCGVLYLDGKGDPVHRPSGERPGVAFDHVFDPDHPEQSARWNPLSGPDPDAAGARLAAALLPDARAAGDQFYLQRGQLVLSLIVPALAYTGFAQPQLTRWLNQSELEQRLIALGFKPKDAESLVRARAQDVSDQLSWLAFRDRKDPEAFEQYLKRAAKPSEAALEATGDRPVWEVTIADVHRTLFVEDRIPQLLTALETRSGEVEEPLASRLRAIQTELAFLARISQRERLEQLASLQNRLAVFLRPPFDQLCGARGDFTIADVCEGSTIALLLNVAKHPAAAPVGRLAVSQLTQAVLASENPQLTKLAVLDEFQHFVTHEFAHYLATARSHGGGAVMALQSLGQIPDEQLQQQLLTNARTRIAFPGLAYTDALAMSREFGEDWAERRSYTYSFGPPPGRPAVGPARPDVRLDYERRPRFEPTELMELAPRHAVVRLSDGEKDHPPVRVDLQRDPPRRARPWRRGTG